MGHVGGELPADALRLLPLRHILEQQHHAPDPAAAFHRGPFQPIPAATNAHQILGPFALVGLGQHGTQFRAAVHFQNVPAGGGRTFQQAAGGRIDAQHRILPAQQHQALLHAVRHGGKIRLTALQFGGAAADLLLLHVQPPEQRRKLVVALVVQGMLQIQLIQGGYDLFGNTPGQE